MRVLQSKRVSLHNRFALPGHRKSISVRAFASLALGRAAVAPRAMTAPGPMPRRRKRRTLSGANARMERG